MPANESPTYNSSRMQRAYRINNIETTRLQGRLNLLEKEKLHAVRVTNQDIRLISLTLDYITSCSGHSPEGLAPDAEMVDEREDEGPFFMYGQRIISRRRRRIKRPQSAMYSGSRRRSDSDFSVGSLNSVQIRPQSSPVRRGLMPSKDSDAESCISDVTLSSSSGSTTSSKHPWMDQTNALTKKLLKAREGIPVFKPELHEKQRRVRRHSAGALNLNTLSAQLKALESPESNEKDKKSSRLGRNAGLSDILNQQRPTLSASAWKNQLIHNRTSALPMSVSAKRQSIHDLKMKINSARQEFVDNKVKTFISQETSE